MDAKSRSVRRSGLASCGRSADQNPVPDPPWDPVSGFQALKILSGAAVVTTASNDCWALHGSGGVSWPSEQYAAITLAAVGGRDCGPVVHGDPTNTHGYMCTNYDASNVYIYEIESGGFTNVASAAGTFTTSNEPYLESKNSGGNKVIKAFLAAAEIVSYTDTTPRANGTPGLFHYDGTSGTASWRGGDFAAGAATPLIFVAPPMAPPLRWVK